MTDIEANNSADSNPYAPPASYEADVEEDRVHLSAEEPYRVVGKNLVCRIGCQQFPDVCWLTGSRRDLAGTHRKSVRYLTDTARGWLLGVAVAFILGIQMMIDWLDVSVPAYAIGILAFVLGGIFYDFYLGKPFTIVVGESVVARQKRQLARLVPAGAAAIVVLAAATVAFVDVVPARLSLLLVLVSAVALLFAYMWLSPQRFSMQVSDYGDDTVLISGLTSEFLEALKENDRFYL